jgi:hypothetical protein
LVAKMKGLISIRSSTRRSAHGTAISLFFPSVPA